MNESKPKSACYNLPPLVGVVTPLLTFFAVEVATGTYSVGGIIIEAIKHFIVLLLATITGTIPFVALSVGLYLVRNHPARVSYLICSVGLVGVTGLTVLGNVAYWYPFYAGERVSSTAGLVFLFIPIYGCMAAVAAFLVGLLASLMPWFRHGREIPAR
jgi:hypothetical protein